MEPGVEDNERRLADFYNRQAAAGADHPPPPNRVAQQEHFIALMKAEARRSLLEVGAGSGGDGLKFVQAGIHYTGVDLAEGQVRRARARGLDVSVASARRLPFADRSIPALWSMNTLVHVPAYAIDAVLGELVRVATSGAPIAVGLWSGEDEEVLNPGDEAWPRFFSRRSDATVRDVFGRHGSIEQFLTWPEGACGGSGPGAGLWTQHYQFLILRTP